MKTLTEKRLGLKLALIELLGGKCIDCGLMPHPVAMDFDHINPVHKLYTIGDLLGRAANGEPKYTKLLMDEVHKCVLRCSNCHRIKTYVNRDVLAGKPKKKRWLHQ